MTRAFLAGFLVCYMLGGFGYANQARKVPATTTFGMFYAGAIWLPFQLVPTTEAAVQIFFPPFIDRLVFDHDGDQHD